MLMRKSRAACIASAKTDGFAFLKAVVGILASSNSASSCPIMLCVSSRTSSARMVVSVVKSLTSTSSSSILIFVLLSLQMTRQTWTSLKEMLSFCCLTTSSTTRRLSLKRSSKTSYEEPMMCYDVYLY